MTCPYHPTAEIITQTITVQAKWPNSFEKLLEGMQLITEKGCVLVSYHTEPNEHGDGLRICFTVQGCINEVVWLKLKL